MQKVKVLSAVSKVRKVFGLGRQDQTFFVAHKTQGIVIHKESCKMIEIMADAFTLVVALGSSD